jgi:hypothetical protein
VWAYLALASGVALIGGSFAISREADDTYAAYLRETDPAEIDRLYDRTVLYDRLASGSLAAGEILLVTGVYLRFIKPSGETRLGLAVGPGRCAVSLRY